MFGFGIKFECVLGSILRVCFYKIMRFYRKDLVLWYWFGGKRDVLFFCVFTGVYWMFSFVIVVRLVS